MEILSVDELIGHCNRVLEKYTRNMNPCGTICKSCGSI